MIILIISFLFYIVSPKSPSSPPLSLRIYSSKHVKSVSRKTRQLQSQISHKPSTLSPRRMGAGKRTQTFILNDSAVSSSCQAAGPTNFRNLGKSHLGGVIFGCKNNTMKECLFKQLFGLPASHYSFVKNIDPGLPLFLFNYTDRKLHGIFEAASSGKLNIDSYGWTTDGSERTPFPAQVQIRVRLQCQALREDQFKPIIFDNYFGLNHFWFELDHTQTNKLISLLLSQAVAPSTFSPQNTTQWKDIYRSLPSGTRGEKNDCFGPPDSGVDLAHPDKSNEKLGASDVTSCFNGNNQRSETYLDKTAKEDSEMELIYMKLKELALQSENWDSSTIGPAKDTAVVDDINLDQEGIPESQNKSEDNFELSDYPSIIAQVIQGMEDLKAFNTKQNQKLEQKVEYLEQKVESLEQKLVDAETEIQRLKSPCMMLDSGSNFFLEHVNETIIESFSELHPNLDELIFLVGGYDGQRWLSALNCYSPSLDKKRSLRPMNSARSYASVAELNGELYVFGGGNGSLWYDTVESYNPATNQWTLRPSLKGEKGSLAGATVNNKIFALGGGNGRECFSDVEMLDLDLGRWVSTQSMLQKRFALAAAEFNGAIYAVGGFDGNEYLKSAERFDPREHSWTNIESMHTKRGCHSLTVMNEKLYVLGGFDGSNMVSSVEIFDPRLGSWTTGEPMNQPRGYSAAAVLKESMYVIGGVLSGEDIINTVECYKDGQGWQVADRSTIGSRCFASAIVL